MGPFPFQKFSTFELCVGPKGFASCQRDASEQNQNENRGQAQGQGH